MLEDRVFTRQNLLRRRVVVDTSDMSCVYCGALVESADNLFVTCVVSSKV
ncbi:hypothetical protein L195_g040048 [Trifolium pratense]|uniref:Uncharacterized protein n=1 Tax=Trifolium pratense TaxID=57577 RepID=A0A2K3LZN5_TRIPR|nr:hypothetical protein L195_g040048 [Trifolium pratense]